jgi:hypothetical protein
LRKLYEKGEDYYYDGDILFSRRSLCAFKKDNSRFICYYHPVASKVNALFEPLIWLSLLEKGFTFIHAAGVELNGKCVALPAWGGSGKTILSILLLKMNNYAKLLGDDMIILSSKGIAYCYPTPFAVYPYHIPLFSDYFQRHPLTKASLKLYEFFEPFASRFFIVKKVLRIFSIRPYVGVPVDSFLPDHRISKQAPLTSLFLLTRSSSSTFHVEDVSKEHMLRTITNVMLHEYMRSPFIEEASAMSSFGMISIIDLVENFRSIVRLALKNVKCYKLVLPLKMRFEDLPKVFEHFKSV